MKVKNKQIFLILFLAGLIGLLGITIFSSQSRLSFYTDEYNTASYFSANPKNISTFDFSDYYNSSQKNIDVEHYTLKFDLLTKEELLKGDVTIKGNLKSPTGKIHLNFYDNFKIENISLNGVSAEYKNFGTSLIISNKKETNSFEINVKYSGKPVELGFGSFIFDEFNDRSVVYTLSEPNFASTWFPCNDITTDKALADIYITNDSSKTSVSNGYLVDIKTVNDKKTYHWKTIYPISTYLISINSADYKIFNHKYKSVNGDSINIEYYTFPEDYEKAKIDMQDHPDYMDFMESAFGEYPFIKEKYGVAEFLWSSGAMEHQTITGFSYKFYSGKKYYSDVLIHELAHQWWGNAVGPASWKDVWLNEGFAKYSEALYWEYSQGKNALQSSMQMIFSDFNDGTLYNPGDDLFSKKVYNKGAWVMHMLRNTVGDKLFFEILQKYYSKYKYKNASTEDFKMVCEEVSGKNLDYFFKQWLYEGEGIISLRYKWQLENDGKIKLRIRQIQRAYKNYNFPIDVLLKENENEELHKIFISSTDTTLYLDSKINIQKIELDPEGWLLAHIWEENE